MPFGRTFVKTCVLALKGLPIHNVQSRASTCNYEYSKELSRGNIPGRGSAVLANEVGNSNMRARRSFGLEILQCIS